MPRLDQLSRGTRTARLPAGATDWLSDGVGEDSGDLSCATGLPASSPSPATASSSVVMTSSSLTCSSTTSRGVPPSTTKVCGGRIMSTGQRPATWSHGPGGRWVMLASSGNCFVPRDSAPVAAPVTRSAGPITRSRAMLARTTLAQTTLLQASLIRPPRRPVPAPEGHHCLASGYHKFRQIMRCVAEALSVAGVSLSNIAPRAAIPPESA
jgi:hypothetical protein